MPPAIEVLDPAVYEAGDPATNGAPHAQYEYLREHAPLVRVDIHDDALMDWCWVVSRYADVLAIDRDAKRFLSCSRRHPATVRADAVADHGGKPTMITLDGADHIRNRRIVALASRRPSCVRSKRPTGPWPASSSTGPSRSASWTS